MGFLFVCQACRSLSRKIRLAAVKTLRFFGGCIPPAILSRTMQRETIEESQQPIKISLSDSLSEKECFVGVVSSLLEDEFHEIRLETLEVLRIFQARLQAERMVQPFHREAVF